MASLSCRNFFIVNGVESKVAHEMAQSWSFWLGRDVVPLDALLLSNMSRLKSLARMIRCLEWWFARSWI